MPTKDLEDSKVITLAIYDQITSSTRKKVRFTSDDNDDHDVIKNNENNVAHGLCIPIEVQGESLGYALIDQGASRSLIRRTALTKIKDKINIVKVREMSVMCSNGSTVPITGCFVTPIYSHGTFIVKTILYIVDNTHSNDIICDVVIGKASLANGDYPCIDLRNNGTLYNPTNKSNKVSCSQCEFDIDPTGRYNIRLVPEQHKNDNSNNITLNMIKVLVNNRSGMTDSEKDALSQHLYDRKDNFMIPTTPHQGLQNVESDIIYNDMILYNFMCDMDKCDKGSVKEQEVISTFLNMYVPNSVMKSSTIHQQKAEREESDVVKELDDIDFPFTPPTTKDYSPEYQQKKLSELHKKVYELDHLDDDQKKLLYDVLCKHHDRFSLNGENMERTDSVEHEIDTGKNHPFRERLRQYSPGIQSIIDNEVVKMLKEGVIIPSKSCYASNLLLVRKPDPSSEGGVKNRVCASFVRLNTHTEKDSYPLPSIQYIYDKIGRSKWFTTMDLLSGFWQVMIKPEHRYKTAFITMRGLYEFVVMPFGLCNAPATFQRLMDAVILPEYREFIETYIDDLMTHSMTYNDHMNHLHILFEQLRKHKLVVKLSKCKFAQLEVKFLGHIISQNIMKTNPEAVEAVKKWVKPTGTGKKAVTAIRGFLGTVNWYRKFIPKCADLQRPLIQLTKKDVKFEWNDECQQAFEKLRDALVSAPVLSIADPNKEYVLHTDASDYAMGAILMQEDENGDLHPIAYASKTFNDAQKNYDTTDREALAVVWALEHFNTYCEGHKYTLITDHQALSYIYTNKSEKKRIHRLALKLANYDVKLYYKPGKDNHMADLLSRNMMDEKVSSEIPVDTSPVVTTSSFHGFNTNYTKKRKVTIEEYEVEKIIDKRQIDGRDDEYEYYVKWKGYDSTENTWEPSSHLQHSIKLIVDYEKKQEQLKNEKQKGDSKTEKIIGSNSKHLPRIKKCNVCDKSFVTDAAYHIHNYHDHSVPVPASIMSDMDITTNREVFKSLQRSEPQFQAVYNSDYGTTDYSEIDKHERRMIDQHEFIISDDDLLYCVELPTSRSRTKIRTQLRLCIPSTERRRLLKQYHEQYAHCGISRMYDKLCERVWWPRMLRDIVDYIRRCELCQKSKGNVNKIFPRPMDLPTRPWSHVHFDHVGPLVTTQNGRCYILTIVDRFTRYAEAFAVVDITTEETAQILVNHIICRYGIPDVVGSDRGPVMVGLVLNQVFKMLGIKRVKTAAHHPQSNGVVEIFNKTLKSTLRIWSQENQKDWDELLPFAVFAYNTSFHSLLRETPYYLNHGIQARDITDDISESDYYNNASIHGYAKALVDRLLTTHHRVRELLEQNNEKREKKMLEEKPIGFCVGDNVLLYDPTTPRGVSRKLVRRWTGPYSIIEKNSEVTYTILREDPYQQQKVNVKRIRLFKDFTDLQPRSAEEETELEIATREVEALSKEIQELQQKKSIIENTHNITEKKPQNENAENVIADDQLALNSYMVGCGIVSINVLD